MSDICEHPFCSRSISSKCSSHCQLDLCHEHLIEHKHLFLVQYEKSFNHLNKILNELIHTIDEKKIEVNTKYQKEISFLTENHKNKLNEIEQKTLLLDRTQHLIKKKVQILTDVKNGQSVLSQYDIEQIKLYQANLPEHHHHHHEEIIIKTDDDDEISSSSASDDFDADEDYCQQSHTNGTRDNIMHFRSACPLTHLGVYGLKSEHNLRLCSSQRNKSNHQLHTHFHHYHHLTWSLSYELTKSILNKLDPLTTCVFRSPKNIIDKRFFVIRCPLKKMNLSNCKKKFYKESLKHHLLNVHHLSLKTSNKIVETFKKEGDLSELHFDEDEFN